MGSLVKLIKNLFSGILSFLGSLIGGKKSIEGSAPKTRRSPGYFLELDEAESPKATAVSKHTAETSPMVAFSEATQILKKESSERSEASAASSNGSVSSASIAEKAAAPVAVAVVAKPEASVEFATKYLVPTSNGSRRRPGANMNSYLDMARAMKPS